MKNGLPNSLNSDEKKNSPSSLCYMLIFKGKSVSLTLIVLDSRFVFSLLDAILGTHCSRIHKSSMILIME